MNKFHFSIECAAISNDQFNVWYIVHANFKCPDKVVLKVNDKWKKKNSNLIDLTDNSLCNNVA
jgi:hypothetical protein